MSKGSGGGGRGAKGGGASGGVSQASLGAAGIEGNAKAISAAWKQQFGTALKSAGEIHSLVGVNKGLLGKHGVVKVETGSRGIEITARGNGVQIGRRFNNGAVKHDHLFIASHMQGKGLGTRILKTSVAQYQRLGVKKITLQAAEAGRYVWPKLGFRVAHSALGQYASGYRAYTKANGIKAPGKIHSVQQIAKAPGGKAFLTSHSAPNMQTMSIRTARLARELKKR